MTSNRKAALLAFMCFGAAAAGCSTRSGYEGLRAGAQNDCALQPPAAYEECMDRLRMDYDEYQQRVAEAEGDGGER